MKLVNLIEEDFVNYRKPGMFLGFPYCSGKCNSPGMTVCQNEELRHVPERDLIDISAEEIVERYAKNPITKCLIIGGLEPFDSFDDLCEIVKALRFACWRNIADEKNGRLWWLDPIVIYTGYYPFEIKDKIKKLLENNRYRTMIIKFGRYIPGHQPHYDEVLGVNLASDNQYALMYAAFDGEEWGTFI